MSTEAIVPSGQGEALARAGNFGFGRVNLKPMPVVLVQAGTQIEGCIAGKFLNTLTNMHYDTFRVVPLDFHETRVLFPKDEKGEQIFGAEPLCRSNDGIRPSPFVETPCHFECATCPKADWKPYWKNKKDRKFLPPCSNRVSFLCIDKKTKFPLLLTISGKSIKPFYAMMTGLAALASGVESETGKKPPLHGFAFDISVLKVIKGKTYFQMKFSNPAAISDFSEYGSLFEKYVLTQAAAEEEATETTAAANVAEAAADEFVDA